MGYFIKETYPLLLVRGGGVILPSGYESGD